MILEPAQARRLLRVVKTDMESALHYNLFEPNTDEAVAQMRRDLDAAQAAGRIDRYIEPADPLNEPWIVHFKTPLLQVVVQVPPGGTLDQYIMGEL